MNVEAKNQSKRMRSAALLAILFVFVLWEVHLTQYFLGINLYKLGVYPRSLSGLIGIIFAPLVHGSFSHLLANTPAVLFLTTALIYGYERSSRWVLPILYISVGVLVWLFARPVYHIGASGLTFGMMFYIFIIGVLRRDKQAIALSLTVFFLYGGMLAGFFPEEDGISYESHMAGAIMGIILAVLLRNVDPIPERKRYSWELEADESTDADGYEYEMEIEEWDADYQKEAEENRKYLH